MSKPDYVSSGGEVGFFNFDQLHSMLMTLMRGELLQGFDPTSAPFVPQGWEAELFEELEHIRKRTSHRGDMQYIVRDRGLQCQRYMQRWKAELSR